MRGINRVFLFGHVGHTPELRTTRGGRAVTELRVATNRPVRTDDGWKEETDWTQVQLWEQNAETAVRFLTKGSAVAIEGRLRTDSWDDPQSGQKRFRTYVLAERLHLGRGAGPRQADEAAPRPPDEGAEHSAIAEEEIPF